MSVVKLPRLDSRQFERLEAQPPDGLLELIGLYSADARPGKIDLGVGVYRNANGATPVLKAVKAAELNLHAAQVSKSYLGPEGDPEFTKALLAIAVGEASANSANIVGVQTPGGTGALRLAAELIARARPTATVWYGLPSWPNHGPILSAAGLKCGGYEHASISTGELNFDAMMSTLGKARPGDVALLHGCCHNPTGVDLDHSQWREVGRLLATNGVMPLIDCAYQGLGDGFNADRLGIRTILEMTGESLIAYSCDKNFGLYRERVGALYAVTSSGKSAELAFSNMLALARANWSMPPDHGAAIVRGILESPDLTALWAKELNEMRSRLVWAREVASRSHPRLVPLLGQRGLFSMLPLSAPAIAELRDRHAIYIAPSGRINVAGLNPANIDSFALAIAAYL